MLTIVIRYKGEGSNARMFVNEVISSGVVSKIRQEEGNLRYDYFFPLLLYKAHAFDNSLKIIKLLF